MNVEILLLLFTIYKPFLIARVIYIKFLHYTIVYIIKVFIIIIKFRVFIPLYYIFEGRRVFISTWYFLVITG